VSAAGERITRLLALVPWLRTHDGITIDEAAEHFGITPGQLEKDLWLLVVCGRPGYGPDQLIDIDFWDEGRIQVLDPQTLGVPMRLAFEEAASLIVALRLLAQLPGAPDAVHTALDALIAASDVEETGVYVSQDPEPLVTKQIERAIAESRLLSLQYVSGSTGEITQRMVEPQRILSTDGRHLLIGYCRLAEAERSFRIDRIVDIEVAEPFTSTPYPVADAEPMQALCLLDPEARWVADVHADGVIEEHDDGRWAVRLTVYSPAWLVALMLSLRGSAEVVDPPDLRRMVADAANDALASYARES
jgi:proteasome accessory factor C